MIVRSASISDKTRAIELLRDSRSGAGFDDPGGQSGFTFPFDPAYAERLFLSYLSHPRCCALVYEVNRRAEGILLAHAYEHPFGPVWFAQERLWWIDPAHRGRAAFKMLDAYDEWWLAQGCAAGGMAGMGEDPAVRKLYERRGYRVAERNFLKAV